jgi:hypothetical protein
VKLHAFNQDDVDSIAEYFLKGAPVFTEDRSVHTKKEVHAMLLNAQNQLSMSRGAAVKQMIRRTRQNSKSSGKSV